MRQFFLCYKYFSFQVYLILVTFTVLQNFQVDATNSTTEFHELEQSIGGGDQTTVSLWSDFIQTEAVRPRGHVEVNFMFLFSQ